MKLSALFASLAWISGSYAVFCCLDGERRELQCTLGTPLCCSKNTYQSCENRGTFQTPHSAAQLTNTGCTGGGVLACVNVL
ncbi:hypothetical protein BST61_g11552 [Cercospora zeina]